MSRTRVGFALGIVAVYVAVAQGVGNLYPFSTFEMYGRAQVDSSSRVVARHGTAVSEVAAYDRWQCHAAPDVEPQACLESWPYYHVPAQDAAALALVRNRGGDPGPDAHVVDLVRRVWRLEARPGPPIHEDCVIARCRAVPR